MRLLRRPDLLVVISLGILLMLLAVLRQEFIGDGIRHLPAVMASDHPSIGTPRWLLFPAFVWLVIHPLASTGLIAGIEPAIRVILAISVVSGIVYLWALRAWLLAERCDAYTRATALMMAGAAMPFLTLYSDIAEAQLPAALAIAALAICRSRFAAGRGGEGTILTTVAMIAVASLLYQAVILSLLFLPLVAPAGTLWRRTVVLAAGAIIMCVPVTMIGARLLAGDSATVAALTTFRGERGDLVRASLVNATPLKWAVALVAGPPQAVVGLWKFQGLPWLGRGLLAGELDAVANVARLIGGLAIVAALAWAVIRTRDWRIGVAALGILALPMIRNQQYTNVKFFLLWPVVVALASTKLKATHAAVAGAAILALNTSLLTRHVHEGRARYADVRNAYAGAKPDDCFFTSDWGPPFWHIWPGASAPLISMLWAGDERDGGREDRVTPAVRNCFCRSARVWTDATVGATAEVVRLTDHFGYTALPISEFLFRPGDGSAVATNRAGIFVYSAHRRAALCESAGR